MIYALHEKTILLIQKEYVGSSNPWYLGFSGGKDSSALLKLVFTALRELPEVYKPITLIYVDTGVEIPLIRDLVIETVNGVLEESATHNIPVKVEIATPKLEDRFFVKVIGRGYPPPTNKFRWCTDRLRINPVKRVLDSVKEKQSLILLGIRHGESKERDRTIERHKQDKEFYFRQANNRNTLIFSPIVEYSTKDIWTTLALLTEPVSLNAIRLFELYTEASGECPTVRDPKGTPCGKGRFGCWTCTVVRKDRAVTSMVKEGHHSLAPLLEFRNWLAEIRDLPQYRCKVRRNGQRGLGPLTLAARKETLAKLLHAQIVSRYKLIDGEELLLIEELWKKDVNSTSYRE